MVVSPWVQVLCKMSDRIPVEGISIKIEPLMEHLELPAFSFDTPQKLLELGLLQMLSGAGRRVLKTSSLRRACGRLVVQIPMTKRHNQVYVTIHHGAQ